MGLYLVEQKRAPGLLELERLFKEMYGQLAQQILTLETQLQAVGSAGEFRILNEQSVLQNGHPYIQSDIPYLSLLDITSIPWIGRGVFERRAVLEILNDSRAFQWWDVTTQAWVPVTLKFRDDSLFVQAQRFGFQVTAHTLDRDSNKYQKIGISAQVWNVAAAVIGKLQDLERSGQLATALYSGQERVMKHSLPILELLRVFAGFTYLKNCTERYTAQTNVLTLEDMITSPGAEKLYLHFDMGLESAATVRTYMLNQFNRSLENSEFVLQVSLQTIAQEMRAQLLDYIVNLYENCGADEINFVERCFPQIREQVTLVKMAFYYGGTSVDLVLTNTH